MIACVAGAAAFLIMFGRAGTQGGLSLIELGLFARGGGFGAGILGVALGYPPCSTPCSSCRRMPCTARLAQPTARDRAEELALVP